MLSEVMDCVKSVPRPKYEEEVLKLRRIVGPCLFNEESWRNHLVCLRHS